MANQDLTPFLDARQNHHQLLMAAADGIDTKALGVLASDFAVLLFMVQSSGINLHSFWMVAILLLLAAALVLSSIVIWPRTYAGASTNAYDHPEYLSFTTERLVKQLIADTEAAIVQNASINRWRWRVCGAALVITIMASLLLFIVLYFS